MAVQSARSTRARVATRRPRPWLKAFKIGLLCVFILLVGGFITGAVLFKKELERAALKIPRLPDIMAEIAKQPTTIVSADGKSLYRIAAEYREPVRFKDVPKVVVDATVAAEDHRFWQHDGIDYAAMGRVLFANAREGRVAQGGSTITMQLAKRVYSDGSKTFQRKVQDMALAVMIERELTKEQILELYLNQVFYGSGAFGIKAAADVYFGKDLNKLTLAEAALLARIVRRPSDENPFVNPKRAIDNRNVVLKIMLDDGLISNDEYEKASREPVKLRKAKQHKLTSEKVAPYFVDYTMDLIERELPNIDITQGGYKIETTIDMGLQREAEDAVRSLVRRYRYRGVKTAAFVLLNRDGQILAMVGGYDYDRRQYNAITQGSRQPGSSFKPFVYATAFELGTLSMYDSISNAPFTLRDPGTGRVWSPKNSSGRSGGSVSVRTAFANSINIPAVRVIDRVGPRNVVTFGHTVFGFKSELGPYLPLALGSSSVAPIEMAEGYSVFMLQGKRFKPFGIRRVYGPDGAIVKEFSPDIVDTNLSASTCQAMDQLMRAVVTSGTGHEAGGVANARGKTGTTSDNRDAWFCGYTDQYLGIGWIANENFNPNGRVKWVYGQMPGIFGGNVTVEMWSQVVRAAQNKYGEDRRSNWSTSSTGEYRPKRRVDSGTTPDEPLTEPDPLPEDGQPLHPAGDGAGDRKAAPLATPGPQDTGDQPTAPARPPTPGRNAQPTSTGEMMTVDICADTGAVANIYCPEVVKRRYLKSSRPRRTCQVHGP